VTYKLRLPEQWNIHPVFHVDLLTPYKETEFHGATLSALFPTSWMAKKNTKWNVSLIPDVSDVGDRYSTSFTGRVIRKQMISGSHGPT